MHLRGETSGPGPGHEHPQNVPIADLIADGESERLEFKSSLRMNLNTRTTDRRVELGALKTLAAFMNSYGGTF